MARRLTAWALTLPLVGASVLGGHALAYALTGREPGASHAYLGHAPEALAIASLAGLVVLAVGQRTSRVALWPLAALAPAVFAVQEHVEHIAHGGGLPVLLGDPTFVVGLLLQAPVAVACAWIARRLVRALRAAVIRRRPPFVGVALLVPASGATARHGFGATSAARERAPPALLRP